MSKRLQFCHLAHSYRAQKMLMLAFSLEIYSCSLSAAVASAAAPCECPPPLAEAAFIKSNFVCLDSREKVACRDSQNRNLSRILAQLRKISSLRLRLSSIGRDEISSSSSIKSTIFVENT
jgi:hypothetical protein